MGKKPIFCDQCGTKLSHGKCGKCNPATLRSLSEIDLQAKEATFNKIYVICRQHANGILSDECGDCDCAHYIYEEAMIGCFGPDIFTKLREAQ